MKSSPRESTIFMSYQESCFGPGQQRDPAAVDEKVAFQGPAGELPGKKQKRELNEFAF